MQLEEGFAIYDPQTGEFRWLTKEEVSGTTSTPSQTDLSKDR